MFFVSQRTKSFFRFTLLYWVAVIAAVILWSREWEIIRLASTKQKEDLFGLFAFCVFFVMTLALYLDVKEQNNFSPRKIILLGLPYLVGLIFLAQTTELSFESWDYQQYEDAFRAIVAGANPYAGTRYLYPPLFAEMMVFVYRIGLRLFTYLGMGKSAWVFVFYIHQASLLYFLLLSFFLSVEFSIQVGFKELRGLILVSFIYLFNVPILRTLSYNQVNFYILTSILLVLVSFQKYPFVAGFGAALGGLIKLYPFALSFPFFFMKKWKVLVGGIVGILVVVLIETKFFLNPGYWKQFYEFYLSFPVEQESLLFRNSSPMSLLRSTFDFLGLSDSVTRTVFIVFFLCILIWFGYRFYQRGKMNIQPNVSFIDAEQVRDIGHLLDFSVISLLIAPSAWEHHYVIAIPLAIWAFALRSRDAVLQTVISVALIFALPVFNIYPFSYLRMAGLLMLLLLVSPKNIEKSMQ